MDRLETTQMHIYLIAAIATLLQFANAGAMTVSGNIALLSTPPVSAGSGDLVSGRNVFAWAEGHNISLLAPLSVDVVPFQNNSTGIYKSNRQRVQSAWSGTVAPGRYDSFIVHADTFGKRVVFTGSITFDTDIAGILFKTQSLITTDSLLGAAGTTYAGAASRRGIELTGSKNWFSISPDLRTLEFQNVVSRNINELRILTNAPIQSIAVPLPASVWMFVSSLCLLGWIRHR